MRLIDKSRGHKRVPWVPSVIIFYMKRAGRYYVIWRGAGAILCWSAVMDSNVIRILKYLLDD